MQIRRHPQLDFFLNLLGHTHLALELTDSGLLVAGRPNLTVSFTEVTDLAEVRRGWLLSTIIIPLQDDRSVELVGVSRAEAAGFVKVWNQKWTGWIQAQVDDQARTIARLHLAVERLASPYRYPAACLLQPYVDQANSLFVKLPACLPAVAIPQAQRLALLAIDGFRRNPSRARDVAIARFVQAELKKMKLFFDRVEAKPLTQEQRLAVVIDEDATLVLAGAGSGKTSVLIAKARYLIEQGIRRPDEVLLLAFGKDAAKEMSDRIGKASAAQVNAKTFHSLAYGIIAEVEGSVPPLAHHAADEKAYLALIRDLVRELATEAAETINLLLKWFSAFFQPWNEWGFKNQKEYSDYFENSELRTLQGEKVRSFEELQIANWLYQQGIDYEYEPDYEHPLPKSGRREYTPDFRLKESGVYIEHFGVRKERQPDGSEQLVPAPTTDNPDQYLKDMEWKCCVHAKHGTTLIETFSYEKCEDEMEWPASVLRKKLRPHVIFRPRQKSQLLDQLAELGQIDDFSRLLGTFLKHFKGAGLTLANCYRQTRELNTGAREAVFLRIFESIFPAYQSRLGSRIDFEDMITRATEHVGSGRYLSPYRHLLIDEFQDISQGRGKAAEGAHGPA